RSPPPTPKPSSEAASPRRSGGTPEVLGASASELLGGRGTRASSAAIQAPRPSLESLSRLWPEPPRKRQLPRKFPLVLAGVGVLLVLIIGLGNRGSRPPAAAVTAIPDDMVVSAKELRNRREVRADDFRPRGGGPVRQLPPSSAREPAPAETSAETLAE